ncbi:Vitamin B12-binding protein [Burkholderia cepacia]|nr:Vitamin B12-binding protein [Burkholderia cepacia]
MIARLLRRLTPVAMLTALAHAPLVHADVTTRDDAGNTVTLPAPAQRVISLAPHATELIYAAGGGAKLVGTVTYSDYPPAAQAIPRVGDNKALDLERIAALKPDLIVVWRHGNAERQTDALRALHIPLFFSEPKHLTTYRRRCAGSARCSARNRLPMRPRPPIRATSRRCAHVMPRGRPSRCSSRSGTGR